MRLPNRIFDDAIKTFGGASNRVLLGATLYDIPDPNDTAFAQKFALWANAVSVAQPAVQGVSPYINVVTDFGADPTGVADSTSAFQNASAHAIALRSSYSGANSLNTSTPVVFVPSGVFKISGPICTIGGTEFPAAFLGCNSILNMTDSTKNILEIDQPRQITVDGLVFVGGKNGIYKNLNNVNGGTLIVRGCGFIDQVTAGYYGETTDRGDAIFYSCLFDHSRVSNTASAINAQGGDYVSLHQCRIESDAGDAIVVGSCSFEAHKLFTGATGNGGYWFRMEAGASASIDVSTVRIGGDNAKKTLWCKTSGANSAFILRDSNITSPGASPNPAFFFDDIPQLFRLENVAAQSHTYGILLSGSIPAASIRSLGTGSKFQVEGFGRSFNSTGGGNYFLADTVNSNAEAMEAALISNMGGT